MAPGSSSDNNFRHVQARRAGSTKRRSNNTHLGRDADEKMTSARPPMYSLPAPVVGQKQQRQDRQRPRQGSDGVDRRHRTSLQHDDVLLARSHESDLARGGGASDQAEPESAPGVGLEEAEEGGNEDEYDETQRRRDCVVVHSADAFALLMGEDLSSLDELDTVEQEIDGAEGEVIVPAAATADIGAGAIKVQNAELLKLMFENYTPPSPTSSSRRQRQRQHHGHASTHDTRYFSDEDNDDHEEGRFAGSSLSLIHI